MNPSNQYFQQQPQMGYGAPPVPGYGAMPAPPRTPGLPPQQQFPPGPPAGGFGQPSPRPPTAQYQSPMPPAGQPNPNQLAQQMSGMSLANGSVNSPASFPPMPGPPMNGGVSPAPNTYQPRPPSNFQPSPMPPQQNLQQPPRPGLAPLHPQMGMSPQQQQFSPGNLKNSNIFVKWQLTDFVEQLPR